MKRDVFVSRRNEVELPEMRLFQFEDFTIEGFRDDQDNVWVVLKDVCDVLGIQNPRDVAARLDEDEKKLTSVKSTFGHQAQKVWLVNESGLYEVIFASNKPIAKAFKRWLRKEVIPSIRQTGKYEVGEEKLQQLLLFELPNYPVQRRYNHRRNNMQANRGEIIKMWKDRIHTIYPEGLKEELRRRAREDGIPPFYRKSFQDIMRCYPDKSGYAIAGAFANACVLEARIPEETALRWARSILPTCLEMGEKMFKPPYSLESDSHKQKMLGVEAKQMLLLEPVLQQNKEGEAK